MPSDKAEILEKKIDFYIETLCQFVDFKELQTMVQEAVAETIMDMPTNPGVTPDDYSETDAKIIFIANFCARFAILNNIGPHILMNALNGALSNQYTRDMFKRWQRLQSGKNPTAPATDPEDDFKS